MGFFDGPDPDGLRRICLTVAQKTGARCAVFAPGGQGLAYALSDPEDVRTLCRGSTPNLAAGAAAKRFCVRAACPPGTDRKAVEEFLQRE